MLIFPAIDILGGLCVRLSQGDYGQVTTYDSDPIQVAARFAEDGAKWIHVVDLDAARTGEPINFGPLSRLAKAVSVPIQVGGGVRTLEYAQRLLDAGISRVIVGTKLVQDPSLAETLFQTLGEQVVAGIDSKDGFVAVHGWTETSSLEAVSFARQLQDLGCKRVIATDVATDGMLQGPNLQLMRDYVGALDMAVIASGGVANVADLAALHTIGVEGVVVGKALYEGRFSLKDAVLATA